jgi:hypothetical protein
VANDGIYTGSFRLQSASAGGVTDNDIDTIAVKAGVAIYAEFNEDVNDPQPVHAPEFGSTIGMIMIGLTIILIIFISRRRR